jgi:hypothetical protein
MTELITLSQANHIMLAILVGAPLIGAIWGVIAKQLRRGLIYGILVGAGNFAMWNVYNGITNHLGLDTVKNLLVNLGLFIALGVIAGVLIGRYDRGPAPKKTSKSTE